MVSIHKKILPEFRVNGISECHSFIKTFKIKAQIPTVELMDLVGKHTNIAYVSHSCNRFCCPFDNGRSAQDEAQRVAKADAPLKSVKA
jgi:hypothetical protein